MPHGRFLFVDETGMNTNLARRYGRATRGEPAHAVVHRNTPANQSLVGAMNTEGILCAMELEGAIDGAAFLVFVEEVLGPHLKEGDFVVLDNLNTHGSPRVPGWRRPPARGVPSPCSCPRYSPDMNPIEKAWGKLKTYLRGAAARTSDALRAALAEGLQTITPADARGWFKHAGYQLHAN